MALRPASSRLKSLLRLAWVAALAATLVAVAPSPSANAHSGGSSGHWGATALRSAYRIGVPTTRTSTIAVVDAFGYPHAEADMNHYRRHYGLPACTKASGCFRKLNQRGDQGSYPKPDSGWAEETAMDLQMVSAACPTCRLILVEASNTGRGLDRAQRTAVRAGATVVSNSWGSVEHDGARRNAAFFRHPGVTTVASTGDSKYGPAHFPATVPGVVAVGGTVLSRSGDSARGWSEKAWAHASSGCSRYFAKPSWQSDSGCHGHRTVADVSAVASALRIYDTSLPRRRRGWSVEDGTSAAAPFVAGMIAAAGGGGLTTKQLYAEPDAFNDVVGGSNGSCRPSYLCTAVRGYDGPTGLGSPTSPEAFAPDL
jgi:subtilase family serine protease